MFLLQSVQGFFEFLLFFASTLEDILGLGEVGLNELQFILELCDQIRALLRHVVLELLELLLHLLDSPVCLGQLLLILGLVLLPLGRNLVDFRMELLNTLLSLSLLGLLSFEF